MDVDELAAPRGDSVKFKEIGDKVQGTVTYVGDWVTRTNNFGDEETSLKIVLDTGNGELAALYPNRGSTMAQAIAEAIKAAGQTRLEKGATLGVKFSETKDTGKPSPLKLYKAVYEAPKPGATFTDESGEEPF